MEVWSSILTHKVVRRGIFTSVKALVQAIMTFIERYNQQSNLFTWTFAPWRLKSVVITGTKHY